MNWLTAGSDPSYNRLAFKPDVQGFKPVCAMDEAARLIKAAYQLDQRHHNRAVSFLGPLVETFAYVGGRRNEIFGAEVRDVDLVNRNFHIRANDIRLLKRGQHRVVPLWPKHRTALRAYLKTHPGSGLLFPAESGGMLKDVRASLESAVVAAGIDKNVTLTTLRHTYGATRIQTLDQGAPVHLFTVAKEMGHRSVTMIEKHYGHLQNVRHRKGVVEYVDNVVEFISVAMGE